MRLMAHRILQGRLMKGERLEWDREAKEAKAPTVITSSARDDG